MKNDLTVVRLKILYTILNMEDEYPSMTQIASEVGIAKSTVTRAIEFYQNKNVLEKHKVAFTEYGREQIEMYQNYKDKLSKWLIRNSKLSPEEAEEEAIQMSVSLKKDTLEALADHRTAEKNNCRFYDIDGFCEKCIDYLLEDGEYDISFTIYKDNTKKHMRVSMANDGFHHPGILVVENGIGTIRLKGKKVVRPIPIGKGMLIGQVDKVSYLMNHRYEPAKAEGDYWTFPTACMKFTYNKGEGVLMGSASLKMSSSVGKLYMPESLAHFAMVLIV